MCIYIKLCNQKIYEIALKKTANKIYVQYIFIERVLEMKMIWDIIVMTLALAIYL